MSYSVSGTTISLTRGDTVKIKVGLTKDGVEYIPQPGDSIRFAVKSTKMLPDKSEYQDTDPLINKQIPINTMTLVLDPQDTKPLPFGNYVYDMEITFEDGTVDTFITTAKFKLTPEVH